MINGTYNTSMEAEISDRETNEYGYDQELKLMITTTQTYSTILNKWFSFIIKEINSNIEEVLEKYPYFKSVFLNDFFPELLKFANNYTYNYIEKLDKRTKNTRQNAINIIISDRYPIELRTKMLQHFSEGEHKEYSDIFEFAMTHDAPLRARPNKGKQGPENPLAIEQELHHINWDKVDVELMCKN